MNEGEARDASDDEGAADPQHDGHCVVDLDGTWYRIVAMTATLTTMADPHGRLRQMTHAPTGQHDDHTLLTVCGALRQIRAIRGDRFDLVDRFGSLETWELPKASWAGYAEGAAALLVDDGNAGDAPNE